MGGRDQFCISGAGPYTLLLTKHFRPHDGDTEQIRDTFSLLPKLKRRGGRRKRNFYKYLSLK
jgi:hypothetical protein